MTDRKPGDGEELETVAGTDKPDPLENVEAESVEVADAEAINEAVADADADEEAAIDEELENDADVMDAEEVLDVAPASERLSGPAKPAVVPEAKARAAAAADDHRYIDDRVSKIWVGLILAVFAGILLYGLLFGRAGMLTPASPSPSPAPSVTGAPSPSVGPSTSPTRGSSTSPSTTPSASPSTGSPPPSSSPSTGSPSPSSSPAFTSAPSASPSAT